MDIDAVNKILGIDERIPLTVDDMGKSLQVTFYKVNEVSERLMTFVSHLEQSFIQVGIDVVSFDNVLDERGKVRSNTAVFAYGLDDDPENMLVNRVSSLYQNPVIGIYEGESPANPEDSNQKKLDSIISVLTYDVVHLAIFVNPRDWTICTMNGAIISNSMEEEFGTVITNCLIPKLTAQVVPPNVLTNINFRYNEFNPLDPKYTPIVEDFHSAARMLKDDGMIMSHTKVSSLKFKNKFHERVIRAYLDNRSGMSYGFMAWQLPVDSPVAILKDSINSETIPSDKNIVEVNFAGNTYWVEVPEIWILSTRSGSDKSNLNISTDIVRMGLVNGEIFFDLPNGLENSKDVKPSYDTLAILAHGVGNSIMSSLIKQIYGECSLSDVLTSQGASLFHWHGYLNKEQLPEKHYIHGENNPSVSCSTKQSAVYSLLGKFEALEACINNGSDFYGDVHIEPHHGTNISSINKLSEIVEYLHALSE